MQRETADENPVADHVVVRFGTPYNLGDRLMKGSPACCKSKSPNETGDPSRSSVRESEGVSPCSSDNFELSLYISLEVEFVFFLPLYVETWHFIVDRFEYCAFNSDAGCAIGELVFHSGPVLYVVVVLCQAKAPVKGES